VLPTDGLIVGGLVFRIQLAPVAGGMAIEQARDHGLVSHNYILKDLSYFGAVTILVTTNRISIGILEAAGIAWHDKRRNNY
jgi:uncharacterized protein YqhQ